MGRGKGLLVTVLLGLLSWLLLAGSAHAEDLTGAYIFADGPQAGSSFVTDASGKVTVKGQTNGFVRPADADCPMRHFEGVQAGGKKNKKTNVPESACVRVVTTYYANEFLDQVSEALQAEAKGKLNQAESALQHAKEGLDFQENSGTVGATTSFEIEKHLKKARKLDDEAEDAKKSGDKKRADALLERAEVHKRAAVELAPDAVLFFLPPTLKPIDAVFQPANTQTVYTENITPRPGSQVGYRWTLVELNDPTCILFESGKPQPNQAIWHHGDTQGPCNHALEGSNGHQGVIGLATYDNYYACFAVYFGSNTGTGPQPPACNPPGPQ